MPALADSILVTGAGSGIGRAVTTALARRGSRVIAVGRRRGALQETASQSGSAVEVLPADITTRADRDHIIAAVGAAPMRAVIHLAGSMPTARLRNMPPADWERLFALHVHARLYLTLALLDTLTPNGRVIFVGSRSAKRARQGAAAYCASYAASMMLASCLKQECAEHHVHVINALPGVVHTDLLDGAINSSAAVFPDGPAFDAMRAAGECVHVEAVGRFFAWLTLDAPNEILDAADTLDIADRTHHAAWLGSDPLHDV